MRQSIQSIFLVSIAMILLAGTAAAQAPAASGAFFVENRGQWPSDVRLMASTSGLDAWVTDRGIVYDFHRPSDVRSTATRRAVSSEAAPATLPNITGSGHVVRMSFVGSGGRAHGVETERLSGHYNYLCGSDTTGWARHVPLYSEASIDHLYAGIDARLLLERGGLRYDLMVAAGADPSQVRIELQGALSVEVDEVKRELVIATSLGEVRQGGLFAYQDIDGMRRQIECAFRKRSDGTIGFAIGRYDRSKPLVIDPLVWGTYLPNAVIPGDWASGQLIVDDAGRPLVMSVTRFPEFPTTPGAYDSTHGGKEDYDICLTRLSANGSRLIFSTFLGGVREDFGTGMKMDAAGSIYIGGTTYSIDFPTTPGAFKRDLDTSDDGGTSTSAFVMKLTPDGASPVYSTLIGPCASWAAAGSFSSPDIALNAAGEVYMAGNSGGRFPTTPGVLQETPDWRGGATDGFVCKLNSSGSALLFSTYFGGTDGEFMQGIALDERENIIVIGHTFSSDLPTTPGAYDRTGGERNPYGQTDLFVVKLDPIATRVIFGTYIGGSGYEDIGWFGTAVDLQGNIYLTGETYSSDFPTTPNAFLRRFVPGNITRRAPYLLKLDRSGSHLHYSTFLDGVAQSISVLPSGDIWMAGGTAMPTRDAEYPAQAGKGDGMISLFNAAGTRFLYATWIGGAESDWVESLVMRGDTAYGVAWTQSLNFPTTSGSAFPDATFPKHAPEYVAEQALFKLALRRSGCSIDATAGADVSRCGSAPTILQATASGGRAPYTYAWIDEQGRTISTSRFASVTPAGTTRYSMIAYDALGCASLPDTVIVKVGTAPAATFSGPAESCLNGTVVFRLDAISGSADSRFRVFVGDVAVTPELQPATTPFPYAYTHFFTVPGTYSVSLVVWDMESGCSDTLVRTLVVHPAPIPMISLSGEVSICEGDSLLVSVGESYAEYLWSNGATTRQIVIRTAGTYAVDVVDRNGCRATSSALVVTVVARPGSPALSRHGDTLYSSPADSYQWYRDGRALVGETRQWLLPRRMGNYTVAVGNIPGCTTLSAEIAAGVRQTVRLDTVRGRVGEPLVLTMRIDPPLETEDDIGGFTARIRIDPKALFVHQGRSPDYPAASDPLISREQSGSVVIVVRDPSSPVMSDSILFRLDLEGLVTGQPLNTVVIESIFDDRGDLFEIAGHGLVILDGCAISRTFGRRARLIETRPNPAGRGDLTVLWHAPVGAEAQLRLVDAMGAEVWRGVLPVGTEAEQESRIPLDVPSGVYMLQLIEGEETMALPVVVRE